MVFCPNCGAPVNGSKLDSAAIKQNSEGENKKRGIKEWLAHPLMLLVVGAIISTILIPQLTSSWQINEKELDLKLRLIDQINTPFIQFMSSLYGIQNTPTTLPTDQELENIANASTSWLNVCGNFVPTIGLYYPRNSDLPALTLLLCEAVQDYSLLTTMLTAEPFIDRHSDELMANLVGNPTVSGNAIDIDELLNSSSKGRLGVLHGLGNEISNGFPYLFFFLLNFIS
jgi:hypothetical protein